MDKFIAEYFSKLQEIFKNIEYNKIKKSVEIIIEKYRRDKQIFIIGNGGSASTASHFACDLGKGCNIDDGKRFKVISLTDNVSWMSAISNDISYEHVFIEQLKNYLQKGDLVIGISASGNSVNVIKAFEYAKAIGANTLGFIGFSGGKIKNLSDNWIYVRNYNYGQVEDFHLILEHIITQYIKKELEKINKKGD